MIHRAMLGSYERFIGILIEHYAGEFPVWLAPVQAIVLPIAERHNAYAESVRARLVDAGARAELDARDEKVGRKVRDGELRKIPYLLVVGDREADADEVSVRRHGVGDEGTSSVEAFVNRVAEESYTRAR
jgi:threonyl-tRNA synthetase